MHRPLRICLILILLLPLVQGHTRPRKGLPRPKNIIFLIGDGVGYNHYLVTNQYFGVECQPCEQFPVRLAMSHYPALVGEYDASKPHSNVYATGYNPALAWKDTAYLKKNFTESAAAATALATGFKTYNNAIGMSVAHDTLENLTEWAKALGKSTGVVTSVEFCHATPAGFVAHDVVRTDYPEIARQMLIRSRCDVIMGCGDPGYDNNALPVTGAWKCAKYVIDSSFWAEFTAGSGRQTTFRVHGKPQTVSDADGDGRPDAWTVIRNPEDFRALASGKTPNRVLGCPRVYETLQVARTPKNGETKDSPPYTTPMNTAVPTLAEMTSGALNVLDNNPRGFFLMIEGGATDWASHSNLLGRLIEEMADFNEAVGAVINWVNTRSSWEETLIIVTGDHETGLLWGEKPFIAPVSKGKGMLPVMKFWSREHSNSLIPAFIKGCGSDLFLNYADERDSVRGAFIQNAELPQLVHFLWTK